VLGGSRRWSSVPPVYCRRPPCVLRWRYWWDACPSLLLTLALLRLLHQQVLSPHQYLAVTPTAHTFV
jgi:hypothetical protein